MNNLTYENGIAYGIDTLVNELNNMFKYRHDMIEITEIAEKLKKDLTNTNNADIMNISKEKEQKNERI